MDKALKTICDLLSHQDSRRKCGAALILAELVPKDKAVVKALGAAIEGSNEQQLSCILEALDAIASPDAIPYVMPLLSSPDIPTKMRAISILAHGGTSVIPLITEQMASAPREYKIVFIDLLARIHSKDSMKILLNMICDKDFHLVKETCEAIRRHVGDATPAQLTRLQAQVQVLMKTKYADSERVKASCLLIIGNIGLPTAATLLIKHASPKESPYIRKNALVALKSIRFTPASSAAAWKNLTPFLKDQDTEVIRHTLEILSRLPDSPAAKTHWKKLLKSNASALRITAARKLSLGDSLETARFLVQLLTADENDVREIAASALSAHKKAPPLLLDELTSAKDDEYAWRLAKILKPHAGEIDKKTLKKLTSLAAKDMLADNRRCDAILYLLRHADPNASDEVLLAAGIANRKAKNWEKAVDCLRKLVHSPLFTSDVAYELSICNLKLSHKELSPLFREKDYALRGLQSLLRRSETDLVNRLTKDKSLAAPDVFYVGFHFAESSGIEHDVGEDLLRFLINKWPKSLEAKASRKKIGVSKAKPASSRKPAQKSKPTTKKKPDKRKKG